jgi:hypothetical protein
MEATPMTIKNAIAKLERSGWKVLHAERHYIARKDGRLEVQLKAPVPESKLQFTDVGLEFVVRYPVDIRRASEIDDNVTRAVLDSLDANADLKAAVAGSPKIRAAIKG